MTFPERRLEWPLEPPETHAENVQDVIPPTERNQDPVQTEMTQGMTLDGSRPLTEAERRAADHDTPVGERVYAPASERVPREPTRTHPNARRWPSGRRNRRLRGCPGQAPCQMRKT
ncbi:MAG: hypothetical protein E6I52_14730 [Chloroflexi bacterium]|nr:MAG: hypothetical protein E6I52_14730 [Chloroflexota bacterium]